MTRERVDLPHLGAQTADSHAHLMMLDDAAGAIERATLAGVMFIVTVADATETPRGTFDSMPVWHEEAMTRLEDWGVAHAAPAQVRIIVGAHPHNAKDFTPDAEAGMRELLRDPRTVGIGEIGLDYYYEHSPKDVQADVFARQLAMAHELNLPVSVHLRDAHDDGLRILREIGLPARGCVIHCFTGGPAEAEVFLDLGCHISFSGAVTFKNSDELRAAAAVVPLDRLLVETDCPFIAPEPNRGQPNEPAWVTYTVERIASVRSEETAELAAATFENAHALFPDVFGV